MDQKLPIKDWIKLILIVATILGVVELTPNRPTGGQYPHLKKGVRMDNEIQKELDRLTILLRKLDDSIERVKVLNAIEPIRRQMAEEVE